jgi:hypothetical protein
VWNEVLVLHTDDVAHAVLTLRVHDKNLLSKDVEIGIAKVPLKDLAPAVGDAWEGTLELCDVSLEHKPTMPHHPSGVGTANLAQGSLYTKVCRLVLHHSPTSSSSP